jgi:predicted nucleic acid-binding protein
VGDVLVDTSAWIEFFRKPRSRCGELIDFLLGERQVCTTPLVIVEVVSGARHRAKFNRLKEDFKALPRVNAPPTLWEDMIESRWRLKSKGISGVSIPDLIVAHVSLAHRKTILTLDRDFWRMRSILGLDLVEIPEARSQ